MNEPDASGPPPVGAEGADGEEQRDAEDLFAALDDSEEDPAVALAG